MQETPWGDGIPESEFKTEGEELKDGGRWGRKHTERDRDRESDRERGRERESSEEKI